MKPASLRWVKYERTTRYHSLHTTLTVTGMGCSGCAVRIAGALEAVSGVVHVDVHQRRNEIIVEHLPAFVLLEVEHDRWFSLGTRTIG